MSNHIPPLFIFISFFLLLNQTLVSPSPNTDFIRTSCGTTRYPDLCFSSLSCYASFVKNNTGHLARFSIALSLNRTRALSNHLALLTVPNHNTLISSALRDCIRTVRDAVYRTKESLKRLRAAEGVSSVESVDAFRFMISDVQTWMSAALTNQETCSDGFQKVEECNMKRDVVGGVRDAEMFTSNALALVNYYADNVVIAAR